jgi:hypothetical protein
MVMTEKERELVYKRADLIKKHDELLREELIPIDREWMEIIKQKNSDLSHKSTDELISELKKRGCNCYESESPEEYTTRYLSKEVTD